MQISKYDAKSRFRVSFLFVKTNYEKKLERKAIQTF